MKYMVSVFTTICVLLSVNCFTTANASAITGNESLLEGNYFVAVYTGDGMLLVEAEFDGSGSGTAEITYHSSDEDMIGETIPLTYTVDENGLLEITVSDEFVVEFNGIVNMDGSGFTAITDEEDGLHEIITAFKRSTGATESLLDGEYYIAGFDETVSWTFTADAVFDGEGNGSLEFDFTSVEEVPEEVEFNYTVSDEGMLLISPADSEETAFTGFIHHNGNGFVLLGGFEPDGTTMQTAYKKSTGASNQLLSGTYYTTGYEADGVYLQKVEFNSDGSVDTEIIQSSFEDHEPDPGVYTVADNGLLTVTIMHDEFDAELLGVASPDGSGFYLVSTADEYRNIIIGMKPEEQATSTESISGLPGHHILEQNYPNPFNPGTVIAFHLPQSSEVTLELYDLLGRRVDLIAAGTMQAGTHRVNYDASHLPSGTYIYRLHAGEFVQSRKLVLIK